MMGFLPRRPQYGALPEFPPAPARQPHPCDVFAVLWFQNTRSKPQAFLTIADLAKALVRRAGGAPLDGDDQIVDQVVGLYGDLKTRRMVAVWTLSEGGGRNEFLGYVWLGGRERGHLALKAALQALELSQWRPAA